ncbi:neurofilament light polypeptide-like [Montipora foliosa]|uniref:neurofilament light polypeptide-like n=1 Tax=Montipora foliosa TaxID=591990 RepID=UPI0035F16619
MVKRSLFDQSTLRQLDKATGDSQEETEVMETDLYQEKCLPSEATTDLEGLRKEKKQLEQTLEGTRKDYEAEMARLDAENRELKTRASKEKEEREKLQELMKTKERELSSLRQELEMMILLNKRSNKMQPKELLVQLPLKLLQKCCRSK